MPKVPFIFDYAKTDADRQIFTLVFGWLDLERPIAAPPGTPADRVQALREGFDRAMKDPALLADAEKVNVGIEPMSGAAIAKFVEDASRTPAAVTARGGAEFSGGRNSVVQQAWEGACSAGSGSRTLLGLDLASRCSGDRQPPAAAQTVEQFYAGRQVSIVVGFAPGGAYDPYARAVARHLPRHLPGAPDDRHQEHAGRRQRDRRQSSLQRRAARRLRARRDRRRRRARAGLRQEERAVRRAALHLARQRQ